MSGPADIASIDRGFVVLAAAQELVDVEAALRTLKARSVALREQLQAELEPGEQVKVAGGSVTMRDAKLDEEGDALVVARRDLLYVAVDARRKPRRRAARRSAQAALMFTRRTDG